MKICAISDTHSFHRSVTIPEVDVLIHSGDITGKGELSILEDFSLWLKEQPATKKLVIFGNHERGFSSGPKRKPAIQMIVDAGAVYLENSSAFIDGIHFYGSPVTPWFYDWEWNVHRGSAIKAIWEQIPLDTNVLITHGPPYGIMDIVQLNPGEQRDEQLRKILSIISFFSGTADSEFKRSK